MAYYNDGKVFRNLPEQVEKNKSDIEDIQTAQKTDESNINTNLNNINAHETRINALESLKMTQDGQNIKLTKSTGEIGNIAVGTVAGTNLLGGNDVTFKTINGEAITGDGNLAVDSGLSSLLWDNLGIGRWANISLYTTNWSGGEGTLVDSLSDLYTDITRYANDMTYYNLDFTGNYSLVSKITMPSFANVKHGRCDFAFANIQNTGELVLNSGNFGSPKAMFANSKLSVISVADGANVCFYEGCADVFLGCSNLVEIGEINMVYKGTYALDGASWFRPMFKGCTALKHLHCTHWGKSFDISFSTQFEETDLVEILNNLDVVSTTQTLTMGSNNLAKLTTDDIIIATGKGWQLV